MKKMFRFAVAALGLFFSAAAFAAAGEVVSCHEHKVGDGYEFKRTVDGKTSSPIFVVGKTDADTITVYNQARKRAVYDKMFNGIQSATGVAYSPKYYVRIECPFTLGETRTYQGVSFTNAQGASVKGNFTITVDSDFSETEVLAGKFKTIRMVSKFTYSTAWQGMNGSGTAEAVSLYSPEVGHFVKMNTTDFYPNGRTIEEHVLFKLHKFPASLFETAK
mgnify:CR=1 FL=1